MLKKLVVVILVLSSSALFAFSFNANSADGKYSYEGVKVCGMCHKSAKSGDQLGIWEKSKHAQAYKTLLTDEANKISQKLYGKNAVDSKECLECHVSGNDVDASLLGKRFDMKDGVQCETCHGPGSEYKSMKVMKDRKEAIAKGLQIYDKPEQLCVKCHNDKNPAPHKKFNFDEMWAKIKHDIPKK